MDVFYWKVNPSNFGDELNTWIWPRLIPELYDYKNNSHLFVAIGTLLNHKLPDGLVKIIFGSGVGYGDLPKIDSSYKIYFVRGPLSAEALSLGDNQYITDPAILMGIYKNDLYGYVQKKHKISFIPHYISHTFGDWNKVCDKIGINCISPFGSIEEVSAGILSSDYIITDAMHGAILADTFRIPWVVVHPLYKQVLDFKWRDWASSMNVNYQPNTIDCIWRGDIGKPMIVRVKNVIKHGLYRSGLWNSSWTMPDNKKSDEQSIDIVSNQMLKIVNKSSYSLSDDNMFKANLNRCLEQVDIIKNDIAIGLI